MEVPTSTVDQTTAPLLQNLNTSRDVEQVRTADTIVLSFLMLKGWTSCVCKDERLGQLPAGAWLKIGLKWSMHCLHVLKYAN